MEYKKYYNESRRKKTVFGSLFLFLFLFLFSFNISALGGEDYSLNIQPTDTIQKQISYNITEYNNETGQNETITKTRWENTDIIKVTNSNYQMGNGKVVFNLDIQLSDIGDIISGVPGQMDYNKVRDELNQKNYTFQGGNFTTENVENLRAELENLSFSVLKGEEIEQQRNIPKGLAYSPHEDSHSLKVVMKKDFQFNQNEYNKYLSFKLGSHSTVVSLTDSLVSYYKLDGTSGDVLDSHGTNDGTNNGATRGVTGQVGDAFDFDGTDDNVDIPYSPSASQPLTLNTWVNYDELSSSDKPSGTPNLISYDGSNSHGIGFHYDSNYNEIKGVVYDSGSNSYTGATEGLSTGTWYMLTLTYDGTTLTLYKDGSQIGTVDASYSSPSQGYMGRSGSKYGDESNHHMDGKIDEVGIWNKALSQKEIWELYNHKHARAYPFETPTNIDSWRDLHNIRWHFNDSYELQNDLNESTTGYGEFASNTAHDSFTHSGWNPLHVINPNGHTAYGGVTDKYGRFKGTFDGNNYTISHYYSLEDDDTRDEPSLFGDVSGGNVYNLNLDSATIGNGIGDRMGALAGIVSGGTIANISITNSFIAGQHTLGTIAGSFAPSNAYNIRINNTEISCQGYECGGLAGITSYDDTVDSISNVYVRGLINGEGDGHEDIGGFSGKNNIVTISDSYASVNITNLNSTTTNINGFTGEADGTQGSVNDSFYNTDMYSTSLYGTGKTTSEMKNRSTYDNAGWDIALIDTFSTSYAWGIGNPPESSSVVNDGYPFLQYYYGIDSETSNKLNYPQNLETKNITNTTADLTWDSVTNASSYDVQLVKSGDSFTSGNLIVNSSTTSTSYSVTGLQNSTQYDWRVRAVNEPDYISSEWIATSFYTIVSKLESPENLQNMNVGETSFMAYWEHPSTLHNSSIIELSDTSDFSNILESHIIDDLGEVDSNYTFTNLTKNKSYYWRVKRTPELNENPYVTEDTEDSDYSTSSVETLQENQLPPVENFQITYNNDTGNINATWDEVTNAEYYELQLSNKSDFSELIAFVDPETGNETDTLQTNDTYQVIGVIKNETYYLRVRADNDSMIESNWNEKSFTITEDGEITFDEEPTGEAEGFFGEFVDSVLGLFPDSEDLSTAQKLMFVTLTMIIISIILIALGWSQTGGVPSAMVYLISFINSVLFIFFLGVGYIPIGYVIVLILIIIGIIFLKLKMGGSSSE